MKPNGPDTVTIDINATETCNDYSAVCTEDGLTIPPLVRNGGSPGPR